MSFCTKDIFFEKTDGVFEKCGLAPLTPAQKDKFYSLATELVRFNAHTNLTAITDCDGIILKHFADSAAAAPVIKENARVLDVGAGGGFPSLPLAILREDIRIVSLDSTAKKLSFISSFAEKEGLMHISALHARAEDAAHTPQHRETFDFVCARAVASLPVLCELCLPFVKKGGIFCAMKSPMRDETEEISKALSCLGGTLKEVKSFILTDGNESIERTLVIIEKTAHTPIQYPRQYATIKARPLI